MTPRIVFVSRLVVLVTLGIVGMAAAIGCAQERTRPEVTPRVEVANSPVSETPVPSTSTPTITPPPTLTPTQQPDIETTLTPTLVPTLASTPSVLSAVPTNTQSPTLTPTKEPSVQVVLTPKVVPTSTATPTATPTVPPVATASPAPSPTPVITVRDLPIREEMTEQAFLNLMLALDSGQIEQGEGCKPIPEPEVWSASVIESTRFNVSLNAYALASYNTPFILVLDVIRGGPRREFGSSFSFAREENLPGLTLDGPRVALINECWDQEKPNSLEVHATDLTWTLYVVNTSR